MMKKYRIRTEDYQGNRFVGVVEGVSVPEVRRVLNCDSRVKKILAIVPETKWPEDDAKNAPTPVAHRVTLNTLRYIDVYDVFAGLNIDMGWFYDAGIVFGENNYTLITVKQVRSVITPYTNRSTGANDIANLAHSMLARLDGFSEETLINLEK